MPACLTRLFDATASPHARLARATACDEGVVNLMGNDNGVLRGAAKGSAYSVDSRLLQFGLYTRLKESSLSRQQSIIKIERK